MTAWPPIWACALDHLKLELQQLRPDLREAGQPLLLHLRVPRKVVHFARQSEMQSSCGKAFRGTSSMNLGIFRGALAMIWSHDYPGNWSFSELTNLN
jgi:hypothetical protein